MFRVDDLKKEELQLLANSSELFSLIKYILEKKKEEIRNLKDDDKPSTNVLDIRYQLSQVEAIAKLSTLNFVIGLPGMAKKILDLKESLQTEKK